MAAIQTDRESGDAPPQDLRVYGRSPVPVCQTMPRTICGIKQVAYMAEPDPRIHARPKATNRKKYIAVRYKYIAVRYIYAGLLRSWALRAHGSTGKAEFGLP